MDCAMSGLKLHLKFYLTGKHLGSDFESIWLIHCFLITLLSHNWILQGTSALG